MAQGALKMQHDQTAGGGHSVVREVLDRLKADGRTALTAPDRFPRSDVYENLRCAP